MFMFHFYTTTYNVTLSSAGSTKIAINIPESWLRTTLIVWQLYIFYIYVYIHIYVRVLCVRKRLYKYKIKNWLSRKVMRDIKLIGQNINVLNFSRTVTMSNYDSHDERLWQWPKLYTLVILKQNVFFLLCFGTYIKRIFCHYNKKNISQNT